MRIAISAGHGLPKGKGCGAVGLIDESKEARLVTEKVIELLRADGHTVYDCTVNRHAGVGAILTEIVNNHNAKNVDLDVSIHFNSCRNDPKGDGDNGGTEVLVYALGGKAGSYAAKIAQAISELGFDNRGVKVRNDLYFLRKTTHEALLVECCFVDDADDVKLYSAETMAQAVYKGITGKVSAPKKNTTAKPKEFRVRVKVNKLNIRKGAGTEYPVVTTCGKGVYTIVKTNGNWGCLKSGAGWINISNTYCEKLD